MRYLATEQDKTAAAALKTELGFLGKALMSCQSKQEGQDSEAVWERNSCFSHLSMSSTQRGHVSNPRERGCYSP